MMDSDALQRRCERERRARQEAEALLEEKSLELYRANLALKDLNANLEQRVQQRTEELAQINSDLEHQIQERRVVEQRLLVTQFSVESSSDSVYWLDQEGQIVYANQAASDSLGYSRDELQGLRIFDIDEVMDVATWPSHWEELRRRGSFSLESTHRTNVGELIPVEVLVNHIETEGIEYNCAFVRDISERIRRRRTVDRYTALQGVIREITQRFLEQDEMNRAINDSLEDLGAHLAVDRAYLVRFRENEQMAFGTHEWLGQGVGAHATQIQDLPLSEFGWWFERLATGEAILVEDVLNDDVPARFAQSLKAFGVSSLLLLPVIVNSKLAGLIGLESAGGPEWIDKQSMPLLHTVVEVFGRAIERRISERERDQHRKELSAALKSANMANHAKTVFLANMSHEIRTPLTAIVGYAQMLVEGGRLDAHQADWVRQIGSSANHLSDLINDVLDLSKIEGGELAIAMQSVDLHQIMRDAVDLTRPLVSEKALELELKIDPGTPVFVETDAKRLKQIVINLIQNAIKFTDRGGVSVVVRPSEMDLPGDAGFGVEVADTGIGMSPERLEQVFRPLDDSYYSIAGERGGAGLGLTISRHLAKLLNGEITGRSKPNHGSVMRLRLPVGAPSKELGAKPGGRPQKDFLSLSGVRCLAIDDNPDNQRIIEYLLSKEGAEVTVVGSGREALGLIADPHVRDSYSVVLLDIQMPVMDGYTVARTMRRDGVELPIIALTAHAMADDRDKCLKSGFDDYVTKPINMDQLIASIQRAIRTGRKDQAPNAEQTSAMATVRSSRADDERFKPLLDAYTRSLAEAHANIRQALNLGDWALLQQLVHKLRGTGANYGFAQISDAAKDCESLILEGADVGRKSGAVTDLLSVIASIEGVSDQ